MQGRASRKKMAVAVLGVVCLSYVWQSKSARTLDDETGDGITSRPILDKSISRSSATSNSGLLPRKLDNPSQPTRDSEPTSLLAQEALRLRHKDVEPFRIGDRVLLSADTHISRLLATKPIEQRLYRENGKVVRRTLVEDPAFYRRNLLVHEELSASGAVTTHGYITVGDHLAVRFREATSEQQAAEFASEFGLTVRERLLLDNTYLFAWDDLGIDRLLDLKDQLGADGRVKYAATDSLLYASAVPNDTMFGMLWGLRNQGADPFNLGGMYTLDKDIDAEQAWDSFSNCTNVTVAVIDTGIDANHPDLKDNVLPTLGRSFIGNNISDSSDDNFHGTHVTGTIAGVGNNQVGVAGVCWKAKVIPIKGLDYQGAGTEASIANSFIYAGQSPAKIVNASFGGTGTSQVLQDAALGYVNLNKILVAAAGNDGTNNDTTPNYPVNYNSPLIVGVAASDGRDNLATFSNFGATTVEIAAPGTEILSTFPVGVSNINTSGYGRIQGTSMATPHVVGAVALLWSQMPTLTPQQVVTRLYAGAETGTFNNNVVSNRRLNINNLFTAVPVVSLANIPDASVYLPAGLDINFPVTVDAKTATVTKVELVVDGAIVQTLQAAPYNFKFKSPAAAAETAVQIYVTDSNGTRYETHATTYKLNALPSATDVVPPGTFMYVGEKFLIDPKLTDSDGVVASAKILMNGTEVSNLTTPPFTYEWAPTAAGNFKVTLEAKDDRGSVLSKELFTIDVKAKKVASNLFFANGTGTLCSVKEVETGGAQHEIASANMENERLCQKYCDIIGPMLSREGVKLTCGSPSVRYFEF